MKSAVAYGGLQRRLGALVGSGMGPHCVGSEMADQRKKHVEYMCIFVLSIDRQIRLFVVVPAQV